MKTIEFKQEYAGSNVYCVVPNHPFHPDHSGRWVKAEVAEKLLECLKKVSSSLENMLDCACADDCRPKAVLHLEIAQKTIKLAEEE